MLKPLRIVEGADETIKFTLKKGGAIEDLTGATAKMVIRRTLHSEVLKTINAVVTPLEGLLAFSLVPLDTAGWLTSVKEENYVFGVSLTRADGKVSVPIPQGEILLIKNAAGE